MAQASELVRNRVENGKYVCSSVEVHASEVSKLLALMLKNLSEAEIKAVLAGLHDVLDERTKTLNNKEQALVAERADDETVRGERNDAASALAAGMSYVRGQLMSLPKEGLLRLYAIPSTFPSAPKRLLSVAHHSVQLLLADNKPILNDFLYEQYVDEGKSKEEAKKLASVIPASLGRFLKKRADKLKLALEAVAKEKREEESALVARDHYLEEWGNAYQGVATILEGFYRLAGLVRLAEYVRPTNARKRGESKADEPIDTPDLSVPGNTTENEDS